VRRLITPAGKRPGMERDALGPAAGAAVLALVLAALAGGAGAVAGPAEGSGGGLSGADGTGGGLSGADGATSGTATAQPGACVGAVTETAEGGTVVSVQGARGAEKTPARLVGLAPDGSVRWVYDASADGTVWSYDVDPLPNGNLFVTSTVPGDTVLYEFDPVAGERVWTERFDAVDTHDADLVAGGEEIVVANMRRNVDGESRDRVFVYNRTTEEITWEWSFREHGFEPDEGGEFGDDWTHLNDVDAVGDDAFLLSPRNFDQVLLVNRSTKEIELRLGADGNHDVLHAQHNPDYLETDDGDPVFLVADSENDRVVEYTRRDGGWDRTWTLTGDLNWPRDADRLPDGNTLVTDSWNHRVLEVTPGGEVVWEAYSPWLVYDAERLRTGDGSTGPAMADVDAPREATLTGAEGPRDDAGLETCADRIAALAGTTATPYPGDGPPLTTTGPVDWEYDAPPGGPDLRLVAGAAVLLAVLALGAGRYRR